MNQKNVRKKKNNAPMLRRMALAEVLCAFAVLLYGGIRYFVTAGFSFDREFLFSLLWEVVPALVVLIAAAICCSVFYRKTVREPLRTFEKKIGTAMEAVGEGTARPAEEDGICTPLAERLSDAEEGIVRLIAEREKEASARAETRTKRMLSNALERAIVPEKRCDGSPDFGIGSCVCPAPAACGDFCDYIFFHHRRICFMLGDIWGEGVSAAFFALRVKTLLREYLVTRSGLKEVVEAVNLSLCADNPETLAITLFLGSFDPTTGELHYVNAGQTPPLLIGERWGFLNVKAGVPLGLYPDAQFEEMQVALPPGRTLILYTNGVTDARNKEGGRFGYDRLFSAAHAAWDASLGAEHILDELRASLLTFTEGRPQEDDFAMICIYYPNGLQMTLRPTMSELERMRDLLYEWLQTDPRRNKIYLACEEIFTNIVNHSGAISIQLNCRREGNSLVLCFTDDGEPFNPLPVQTGDREFYSLAEGGMGLAIIRQIAGEIYYRTKEHRNILTVKFPLVRS